MKPQQINLRVQGSGRSGGTPLRTVALTLGALALGLLATYGVAWWRIAQVETALVNGEARAQRDADLAASISDNAGGSRVLDAAMLVAPGLRHLWCDQGFKAGFVADADEDYDVTVTVVNNPDPHRFEIAVRRWVIERTNAWVSAHRRCGKRDLERTVNAAETWITLSQIDVMLNRLAPKPDSPQQRVRDLREADVRDGLKTKHRWGKVG